MHAYDEVSRQNVLHVALRSPDRAYIKLNPWRVRKQSRFNARVAKQRQRDTRHEQDFTIPPYYELDSFLRASLTQSPVNSQLTQYNRVSRHGDSFASQTASRTRPWLSRNERIDCQVAIVRP